MMGIYNLFFFAQPRPQVPTKEAFSRVVKEKGDWNRKRGSIETDMEKHFMEN